MRVDSDYAPPASLMKSQLTRNEFRVNMFFHIRNTYNFN